MNKKKLELFYVGLLLFIIAIPSAAAASLNDIINRIQTIVVNLPYYRESLSFMLMLIIFLSAWSIGGRKATEWMQWPDSSRNAVTAISVALGFASTITTYFFLSSRGIYLTDVIFGGLGVLLLIAIIAIWVISKVRTGGETTPLVLFIIAAAIVLGRRLLEWLFPGFPTDLGNIPEFIIDIIYWLAVAYMLWSIIAYFFNFMRAPTGLAADTLVSGASRIGGASDRFGDWRGRREARRAEARREARERAAAEAARRAGGAGGAGPGGAGRIRVRGGRGIGGWIRGIRGGRGTGGRGTGGRASAQTGRSSSQGGGAHIGDTKGGTVSGVRGGTAQAGGARIGDTRGGTVSGVRGGTAQTGRSSSQSSSKSGDVIGGDVNAKTGDIVNKPTIVVNIQTGREGLVKEGQRIPPGWKPRGAKSGKGTSETDDSTEDEHGSVTEPKTEKEKKRIKKEVEGHDKKAKRLVRKTWRSLRYLVIYLRGIKKFLDLLSEPPNKILNKRDTKKQADKLIKAWKGLYRAGTKVGGGIGAITQFLDYVENEVKPLKMQIRLGKYINNLEVAKAELINDYEKMIEGIDEAHIDVKEIITYYEVARKTGISAEESDKAMRTATLQWSTLQTKIAKIAGKVTPIIEHGRRAVEAEQLVQRALDNYLKRNLSDAEYKASRVEEMPPP